MFAAKRYPEAARALRSVVVKYQSAWAAYALGQLYGAGLGVPRSSASAVHWYRWSAEHGSELAARQLANAYLHGTGARRSAWRAAYWFRVGVAPEELAGSDAELGHKYAVGAFLPRNPRKARLYQQESVSILRRLVRQPNGPAELALGSAYADGRGVARDRVRALTHLCRALALGDGAAAVRIRQIAQAR
ncbi:MAG: tetratricopeptide repeat protein [Steroidobacteraceae bacterium]